MTKMSPRQQCRLAASEDIDSQPIPQPPPVPMPAYNNLVKRPDQDLTLTPDRGGTEAGILKRGRRGKQAQRQVRFDISPKAKAIAINPTGVFEEEPVIVTVIGEPSCSPSDSQTLNRTVKGKDVKGKKNPKNRMDQKQKQRKSSSDGPLAVLTEGQSGVVCEGAELNTTLALKAELEELAEATFDSRKAVQKQLNKSTRTKNNIAIRATEGVNIPRSQHLYRALVSVSVSEDQLISQALHDRLTMVPPSHGHRSQDSPPEGPDLLAFYSPGSCFESLHCSLETRCSRHNPALCHVLLKQFLTSTTDTGSGRPDTQALGCTHTGLKASVLS